MKSEAFMLANEEVSKTLKGRVEIEAAEAE
jgi:hypothetical protein